MRLNKPSPRLAILRAQLAAEADSIRLQRASYKISNAVGYSCPVPAPDADSLPLPPDYWSDLEHWLKTLAPAKPATDRSLAKKAAPEASRWHEEAPPVPGVYAAECEPVCCAPGELKRHWDGVAWSRHANGRDSNSAVRHYERSNTNTIVWHHLIEADEPAAQLASTSSASDGAALVGAKLTHSVCIKAHGFAEWVVGEVMPGGTAQWAHPENWRECDESGWIPHTPTADSTCPVPDGVNFEAKTRDGDVSNQDAFDADGGNWRLGHEYNASSHPYDIIAWRPITNGSK